MKLFPKKVEGRFPTPSKKGMLYFLENYGEQYRVDGESERLGYIHLHSDGAEIKIEDGFWGSTFQMTHVLSILNQFGIAILNSDAVIEHYVQKCPQNEGWFESEHIYGLQTTDYVGSLFTELGGAPEYFQQAADDILKAEKGNRLLDFEIHAERVLQWHDPVAMLLYMTKILGYAQKKWTNPQTIIDLVTREARKNGTYGFTPEKPNDARPMVYEEEKGTTLDVFYLLKILDALPKDYKKIVRNTYSDDRFEWQMIYFYRLGIPFLKLDTIRYKRLIELFWNSDYGGFKRKRTSSGSDVQRTDMYIQHLRYMNYELT